MYVCVYIYIYIYIHTYTYNIHGPPWRALGAWMLTEWLAAIHDCYEMKCPKSASRYRTCNYTCIASV